MISSIEKFDKETVEEIYNNYYSPLVDQFCSKVAKYADYQPPKGESFFPAPFLPIIGNGYYDAKFKVAFFGMDTKCWHDVSRFVHKFRDNNNSLTAVKAFTDGIEGKPNMSVKNQRFHIHYGIDYWKQKKTSFGFWEFLYSTLAGIYNVREDEVRERADLLRTFIWGNVNAYESYDASCEKKGLNKDVWKQISSASKVFNSAQLLLPYTSPDIMVVFYWGMSREWLTGKKGQSWERGEKKNIDWTAFFVDHDKLKSKQKDVLIKYIRCFYLSDTGTYVFKTMHPQGMRRKGKGLSEDIWKAAILYAIHTVTNNLKIFSAS